MAVYLGYDRVGIVKYISEAVKENLKTLSGTYIFVAENAKNAEIDNVIINGNSIQTLLPDEYQEVEYIENSGTQRIDTGLVPTNSTSIDIVYQSLIVTGTSQYILGSRANTGGMVHYALNGSSTSTVWDVRFNGVVSSLGTRTTNKYRSKVDIVDGNGSWSLTDLSTGETLSTEITGKAVHSVANLYLFAYLNDDTNTHKSLRIFACKIHEAGALVRDYIPCYRKSDKVAGLYDLANNEFYTNAGTGTFNVGADYISQPSLEQPIEIQSVGEKTVNLWEFDLKEFSVDTKNVTYTFKKPITKECSFHYRATDYDSSGNIWIMGFKYQNGSYVYLYPNHVKQHTIRNITATEENPLLSVEIRNGGSSYISAGSIDNFMLVEGSYTSDTMPEYEPYGYKIPVKVSSKNLFNPSNVAVGLLNSDGTVAENNLYSISDYIPITTPVTLSYIKGTEVVRMGLYDKDKNFIKRILCDTPYTLTQEASYVRLSFTSATHPNPTTEIQLEPGSESTVYESYTEPTTSNIYLNEPLRMINDIADTLDYKNKKVIRNVGSVIYNATESWSKYDSGNGYMEANTTFPDGKPVLCNMFVNSDKLIKTLAIRKNYSNIYVYGVQDYYPTVDEWHAFLAKNNMEVIGQLVTPTEEEIEVPSIVLQEGTNTVVIDTEIEPTSAELTYWEVEQ